MGNGDDAPGSAKAQGPRRPQIRPISGIAPPLSSGQRASLLASVQNPERRVSPRVPLDIEVSLTSESQFYVGLTGDLSEGGLFVPTYQSHRIGAPVDIELTIPSGVVRARGTVRWIRETSD